MSNEDHRRPWRPTDTLAARVFLVRRELGLSQREAADRTGVTFGTWQGMENGRSTQRLDEQVAKIAETFGVDRAWLMWGGDLEAPKGRP